MRMWGVDPGQQPNPHPASCPHSSLVENRGKVKRPVYHVSDALIGKATAMHTSQENKQL